MSKRRGLGRNLDALLGGALKEKPASDARSVNNDDAIKKLPVEFLQSGQYQPRHVFDETALQELAQSIKSQGIIQPIVVRQVKNKRYEILAGERRWRAAKIAGLAEVPVVVRDVENEAAFAISLIENIQREDLNPLEEAQALKRLVEEFSLTHQQVAEIVGKSRTTVTNLLRLMNLDVAVMRMLEYGDIEMGHARALLAVQDGQQVQLAKQVVEKNLTVRQTEELVQRALNAPTSQPIKEFTPKLMHYAPQLEEMLHTKVKIQEQANGKGKMVIHFKDEAEFQRLLRSFLD